jgi:hypothetical protein
MSSWSGVHDSCVVTGAGHPRKGLHVRCPCFTVATVKVSTSKGRLLLSPSGRSYWNSLVQAPPLTQPVDDMLGLDAEDLRDFGSCFDQLSKYGPFWGAPDLDDEEEVAAWVEGAEGQNRRLLARGRKWANEARPRFLKAARRAQQGYVAALLADDLGRVRYRPGRSPDEVHDGDLPALAAWSLVEALRRQPITLGKCRNCRRPWIVQPGQEFCQRTAPGHVRDCRTLAKEAAFLGRPEVQGYRREYKRLHELKRRGTISAQELNEWRQQNSPKKWRRYDDWKERRKETSHG